MVVDPTPASKLPRRRLSAFLGSYRGPAQLRTLTILVLRPAVAPPRGPTLIPASATGGAR